LSDAKKEKKEEERQEKGCNYLKNVIAALTQIESKIIKNCLLIFHCLYSAFCVIRALELLTEYFQEFFK
jgi:hypothetical protein